jgi:hypothetical protein
MLVSDMLYTALRLAGVVQAAGRSLSTAEMSDAFDTLNALIDGWNGEDLALYAIEQKSKTLTAVASFTIGPTGDLVTTARPVKIQAAEVYVGLLSRAVKVMSADEWGGLQVKGEISNVGPEALFYEPNIPNGTVRVAPIDAGTNANSLKLYVWSQLSQFAAQGDTVTLPPAYLRAIEYNLAVELSLGPRFIRFPMDPNVPAKAADFKAKIVQMNAQLVYGPRVVATAQGPAPQGTRAS